ncbi:glycoside hydrolase family protein [Fictibacillus nanhaiensis]
MFILFTITFTTFFTFQPKDASASSLLKYNDADGWWKVSGYDSNKTTDRVISGDFNGDGKTDSAAFYDYGLKQTKLHVWLSNGTSFTYQGPDGWWNQTGYDANMISKKVIAGDFTGDGKDDIAAFYDYGTETRVHVWKSTGSSFTYQGENGWWKNSGYDAKKITGRVVSNDFNNDGKTDLAAFYDYGSGQTRLHVWLSTGTSFTYQGEDGWWNTTGYNANMLTDRVVSGDFNKDGKADIAAFYNYNDSETRIHVWNSTGASFSYQGPNGWWSTTGYNANKITGRVTAGDFNNDGITDIAALYDYGNSETRIHMWLSSGTLLSYQTANGWWMSSGYNANMTTGRVIAGNFNGDNKFDIATLYDYGSSNTRIHVWTSEFYDPENPPTSIPGDMRPSNSLVTFVAEYEGYSATPYRGADYKNLTIGYGHVIQPGENYTSLTKQQAWDLLKQDITSFSTGVNYKTKGTSISQQEFDSFVSFAYNVGLTGFSNSTLLSEHKAGASSDEIKVQFLRWVKVGEDSYGGLWRRRMDEWQIYDHKEYIRDYPTPPAGYK